MNLGFKWLIKLPEVGGYKLGKVLNEGKTKQIYEISDNPGHVLLLNKDRISAHNGKIIHDMEGKAEISNKTNAKVFELLNKAGVKTAFVKLASDKAFIARACDMVPIEWVTRRLATGSYLKVEIFTSIAYKTLSLNFREIPASMKASVSFHQSKRHSSKMTPMMIPNGVRSKLLPPISRSTMCSLVCVNELNDSNTKLTIISH